MLKSSPTIPTELVDHILGFLHSDRDYDTLETCSGIFPQVIDRHLYSQITVFEDKPETISNEYKGTYVVDPDDLSFILLRHPHIANYVRLIRIVISKKFPFRAGSFQVKVSSILPTLSRIESIALCASDLHSWYLVDLKLCTAVQSSIRLPSIKEVDISNIDNFPLNVFRDCKNLRRLILLCQLCRFTGKAVDEFPCLLSLGIEIQSDMAIMTRIVSSCTLHTLSLSMTGPMDLPRCRTLIEACSATLVNLELDHSFWVPCRDQYSTDPIFPGLQLPLLEQIIIKSRFLIQNSRRAYSSLPLLAPFFYSISSIRTRPIHLRLHVQFYFGIACQSRFSGLDWSSLASLLVLPVFCHPIEVCIELHDVLFGAAISSFTQNSDLKRLLDTGKLVIEQSKISKY